MLNRSGIYKITCTANDQFYIGSSVALRRRRNDHFRDARLGEHKNAHLQSAWNKYGEASFVFEVLLLCSKENLIMYEQICMDGLRPRFNKDPVAGSKLGSRFSEETKRWLSEMRKGKKLRLSEEARARKADIIRENSKKVWSDPGRAVAIGRKISASKLAKPWSKEQSDANAARKRGNKNMLGKIHTLESREKMSNAMSKLRYDFNGVKLTSREISAMSPHDIDAKVVHKRLMRGWSIEKAISTPRARPRG